MNTSKLFIFIIGLSSITIIAFQKKLPTFEDFLVKEQFNGKPAKVDFTSNQYARKYRTVLSNIVRKGPNFAGHFTIVEWGCGSSCQEHAIVNAKNGKVFFPSKLLTTAGISFKLNSSLVITDPIDTIHLGDWYFPISYSYYYYWEGSKLILVDSSRIYIDSSMTKK